MQDIENPVKYKTHINRLLISSKEILADCIFPGGAIVAANSFKPYFPKDARNYKFVWPRDAVFICMAAELLDIDIQEDFLHWCAKTEGWINNGLLHEKYFLNGKKAGNNFQPDQTGLILMLASDLLNRQSKIKYSNKIELLIKHSAEGLCNVWNKNHFKIVSQDIWGEKKCFPDLEENFTFSIAACSCGLNKAAKLFDNYKWEQCSQEMKFLIETQFSDYYFRSVGKLVDKRIDSSMLGLVWPFQIVNPSNEIMRNTVKQIEEKLVKDGGIYRYENDEYDGWMYNKNIQRCKGAGYWPVLNFWMAIYYQLAGNNSKAANYYNKILENIDNNFIPE